MPANLACNVAVMKRIEGEQFGPVRKGAGSKSLISFTSKNQWHVFLRERSLK